MKFTVKLEHTKEANDKFSDNESIPIRTLPYTEANFRGFYNTLSLKTNEIGIADKELKPGKQYLVIIEEIK